MVAPVMNSRSDSAHTAGNLAIRPVILKILCVSSISRCRKDFFFRLVLMLISSRIFWGLLRILRNTPSVNSTGVICSRIKKPVIIPMQANNWIAVIRRHILSQWLSAWACWGFTDTSRSSISCGMPFSMNRFCRLFEMEFTASWIPLIRYLPSSNRFSSILKW